MSVDAQASEPDVLTEEQETASVNSFTRIVKFSAFRLLLLFFTVVISIFLTIMIANMGGHVDNIMRGEIRERLGLQISQDPNLRDMPQEAKKEYKQIQENVVPKAWLSNPQYLFDRFRTGGDYEDRI